MSDLVCADCGQRYKPNAGHCAGGRYEGCCKSFHANRDFDDHLTGSFNDPANPRRCLTDAEMREAGWVQLDGMWNGPKAQANQAKLQRMRDARMALEGVSSPHGATELPKVTQ